MGCGNASCVLAHGAKMGSLHPCTSRSFMNRDIFQVHSIIIIHGRGVCMKPDASAVRLSVTVLPTGRTFLPLAKPSSIAADEECPYITRSNEAATMTHPSAFLTPLKMPPRQFKPKKYAASILRSRRSGGLLLNRSTKMKPEHSVRRPRPQNCRPSQPLPREAQSPMWETCPGWSCGQELLPKNLLQERACPPLLLVHTAKPPRLWRAAQRHPSPCSIDAQETRSDRSRESRASVGWSCKTLVRVARRRLTQLVHLPHAA